jgi:hypothetical protein
MSIGQLGHHIGLHVSVNLVGKKVGDQLFGSDQWVQGVVVGLSGTGDYVTVKLDQPIGAGQGHGLLHRGSKGQDLVMFDDPTKVRALTMAEAAPGGVPDEIAELVRRGKTVQAIKRYRELNGATLDEARAAIANM